MDPDANLEEQLALAHAIADDDGESEDGFADDATRLAELVIALDEWIAKGGFLPTTWQKSRNQKG